MSCSSHFPVMNKKESKGLMASKIDREKTFDVLLLHLNQWQSLWVCFFLLCGLKRGILYPHLFAIVIALLLPIYCLASFQETVTYINPAWSYIVSSLVNLLITANQWFTSAKIFLDCSKKEAFDDISQKIR